MKTNFLKKKKYLTSSFLTYIVVTKAIFKKNAVLFKLFINQRILKKVSQVSNIENKSNCIKCILKYIKNSIK